MSLLHSPLEKNSELFNMQEVELSQYTCNLEAILLEEVYKCIATV